MVALRHAAASPLGDTFRQSLPPVGIDGTMRSRLGGELVIGKAWMKTGSLNDVRTIAGYLDAASGRRYAVVLLINGPRAEGSAPVQDQWLRWIYANG
ncbi:MAG: D-alanyl-D-alanine carboxypeptidase [Burkholderiaceae bacterium]|nr:D-alanyl-D-alanine carboxypeptidase [Burkholderiaceae bacterium]